MDYFFVGNHLNNIGLLDFQTGGDWKREKISIALTMHQFFSHAVLMDPVNAGESLKRNLGTEIDLATSYAISENISIGVGYSHMFATTSMEVMKGGNRNIAQNWMWCMVSCTPVFFNSGN